MNSDHAPTAEERLPPLDEFECDWEDHAAARIRCYARDKGYCEGTAADALVTELGQREEQLLAALRENREQRVRAKYADNPYREQHERDMSALTEKDARIAELEQRCNTFMQGLEDEEKDCEALHAKLRAVSDALDYAAGYDPKVDDLIGGLRTIIGKKD